MQIGSLRALSPHSFETPRGPVAWGGGSHRVGTPEGPLSPVWRRHGKRCVGAQQDGPPPGLPEVCLRGPSGYRGLGASGLRGTGTWAFFGPPQKSTASEPSPSFLFPAQKMFTTVIIPIFQNVNIKEKSFVIPVHLLSKYTVIRVSYVIWQWMLDHPSVLSVPFLKAMGILGAWLSVFTALPQHLFQKQLKRLDWVLSLNFQLTSKNVWDFRYNTIFYSVRIEAFMWNYSIKHFTI